MKYEDPKDDIKLYVCIAAVMMLALALIGGH
jgi:hypothetical protein